MSSNKRSKTATSEAARTIEKAIESTNDLLECERIQHKLKQLLKKADAKLADIEEAAKENGLEYEGEDAVECDCGNKVDPDGEYAVVCVRCEANDGEKKGEIICVECSTKCHICEELIVEVAGVIVNVAMQHIVMDVLRNAKIAIQLSVTDAQPLLDIIPVLFAKVVQKKSYIP
eukprot:CAMPEP_0201894268 /NCGR_PEP_ID=MMETSP0902-20130614/40386_1 /ASSEMBLY_ACC=CAM_ASM_000551 /TAXON_ID=420261 /ORGANISM="Thalassiosira antarctica, Strain CCMP982" /LENGTH=173 /DNA_ID=CAMNT_0048426281 /DNA_START=274 /DNA_END=792 /DNA_ORIENTATION=+